MRSPEYTEAGDGYQLSWLIRLLYRCLLSTTSERLKDVGISIADRSILELLYSGGPKTVPEMASIYRSSRQNVQVCVNGLIGRGLLTKIDNPRHKRSSLIQLTDSGRIAMAPLLQIDIDNCNSLVEGFSKEQLATTIDCLSKLLEVVSEDSFDLPSSYTTKIEED